MKKTRIAALMMLLLFASSTIAQASWIWSPDIGKWINPKKAAKDTPEEQYDWALQFFNQKDWDRAIEEFEKLEATFPTSRLAAEAVYYEALGWEQKNEPAKAADCYQKLVDRYPYSDRIKDAVKNEFEIANEFAGGGKVKMLGMPVLPGQEKAVELYNHIIKNAPFGSYGDQAQYKLAELYQSQGEYELAQKAFQAVVDEYPSSDLVPKAKYQIANASMQASNKGQYDEQHAEQAIEQFKEFKDTFPVDQQAVLADESIKKIRAEKAQRSYDVAAFYEKQQKWSSAKVYYEELIRNYPETPSAAAAKKKLEDVIRRQNEPAPSKFPKLPKLKLW